MLFRSDYDNSLFFSISKPEKTNVFAIGETAKSDNTYFIIPKAEQKNNVAIDSVFISQNLENFYEIGVKLSAFGDEAKNIPITSCFSMAL